MKMINKDHFIFKLDKEMELYYLKLVLCKHQFFRMKTFNYLKNNIHIL